MNRGTTASCNKTCPLCGKTLFMTFHDMIPKPGNNLYSRDTAASLANKAFEGTPNKWRKVEIVISQHGVSNQKPLVSETLCQDCVKAISDQVQMVQQALLNSQKGKVEEIDFPAREL